VKELMDYCGYHHNLHSRNPNQIAPMNNPIIDEVRAARASIAAAHGYDREKILAWARAEQAAIKNMNSNKASLLKPDPPPVPAAMTATTSTRSRSRAVGQA
jgi:hypothetical protein